MTYQNLKWAAYTVSTPKITKQFVDKLPPPETGQVFHRDSLLKGFAVRVTAGGSKAFILEKRIDGKVKRITLGRYPEITVEQARKKAQEFLGEIATGTNPITKRQRQKVQSMTLWDVWLDYKTIKSNLKPRTYAQYEYYFNGELKDWKTKPFASINRDMVVKRHNELKERLSPSFANNVMRVLSALHRFAQVQYEDDSGDSLFPSNPVLRITQLKAWAKEPRRQTILKPHQLPVWYAAIKDLKFNTGAANDHVAADYFLFLLLSGLRRNEAATLTWDNVDFADKTFFIPDTKNNTSLTLPMSDVLEAILKYRLRFKTQDYVFSSRKAGYFANPKGATDRLRSSSGLEITMHDLRRTFITTAESLDISMFAIKQLVNHKSGSDVTSGYVIKNFERLREPMQRITDYFKTHCKLGVQDFE
jgi:integrase